MRYCAGCETSSRNRHRRCSRQYLIRLEEHRDSVSYFRISGIGRIIWTERYCPRQIGSLFVDIDLYGCLFHFTII